MAPLPEENRRPHLLVALRRTARPDRARVAAYEGLSRSPGGWEAYAEFLSGHRAWLDALGRTLARSGATPAPVADGGEGAPAVEELPAPATAAHRLGYLYVYEAFRLGRAVLARRVRGAGAAAGADPGRPWSELVGRLAGVPAEEHAAVLDGARDAFAEWERRLGAALARLGLGPSFGRAA